MEPSGAPPTHGKVDWGPADICSGAFCRMKLCGELVPNRSRGVKGSWGGNMAPNVCAQKQGEELWSWSKQLKYDADQGELTALHLLLLLLRSSSSTLGAESVAGRLTGADDDSIPCWCHDLMKPDFSCEIPHPCSMVASRKITNLWCSKKINK